MSISDHLSSSLGRKDQKPNIDLGKKIVKLRDQLSLNELKKLLSDDNTPSEIIADVIKTLESVGDEAPDMISDFYPEIKKYLNHEKNHLVWRAMCVMAQIAPYNRTMVYQDLARIIKLMDEGSVITRDHGIKILVDLYHHGSRQNMITPLLEEQILKAPDNQLGQYAEKWMRVIHSSDTIKLDKILQERFPELVNEAHRKRVEKIIKKLSHKIRK